MSSFPITATESLQTQSSDPRSKTAPSKILSSLSESDKTLQNVIKPSSSDEGGVAHRPAVNPTDMVCPTCGKMFTTLSKYRSHKTYHKKARSLACGYCSRQFRMKGDLVRHERVHTGERPYKCRFCEKTYKRTSTRRIHETSHMKHLLPL